MMKLLNRTMFGFASQAFDVAVIGGGPGGIFIINKATLLPSRLHSLASRLLVSKAEGHSEALALT